MPPPDSAKVRWLSDKAVLGVDSYSTGPIFSWLALHEGRGWAQCHKWSRCRDVVGTYLQGALHKKAIAHGGIGWAPGSLRPPLDRITLAVRLTEKDLERSEGFTDESLARLIGPAEDALGLEIPTRMELTEPGPTSNSQAWFLTADPFWMLAPPLLSTYLLFVRSTPYMTTTKRDIFEILDEFRIEEGFDRHGPGVRTLSWRSEGIRSLITNGTGFWNRTQRQYYSPDAHFWQQGLDLFSALTPERREAKWHKKNLLQKIGATS